MDEKEPTTVNISPESENVISRKKVTLHPCEQLGLPPDATEKEINKAAFDSLLNMLKELNEINDRLNQIESSTSLRRLLGKVAIFLGFQKETTKPTNLVD